MEKCKTCVARNEGGYCTSKKFDEGSAIEFPNGESDDMLLYSYHEDGGFWVGDNFGCVHHKTMTETREFTMSMYGKKEDLYAAMNSEIDRLRTELETEKQIRINYQDTVYNVCNTLDKVFSRSVKGGEGTTCDMVAKDVSYLNRLRKEAVAELAAERKKREDAEKLVEVQKTETIQMLRENDEETLLLISQVEVLRREIKGAIKCLMGGLRPLQVAGDLEEVLTNLPDEAEKVRTVLEAAEEFEQVFAGCTTEWSELEKLIEAVRERRG